MSKLEKEQLQTEYSRKHLNLKDLKVISETTTSSDGRLISVSKDSQINEQPYGNISKTIYECPCGKGTVEETIENIPGYKDWYTFIYCEDCNKVYYT